MKTVRFFALVLGAILLHASPAFGLSGSVMLPFSATYTAPDGAPCTHRGADVALESGEAVTSPVEGSVAFAGRIPGPHGGSVLAVTIAAGDTKVTLLPLADLSVVKGEAVALGDELGACAESGDPSSGGPHIHLSQRRGDLYVDPSALIAAPPAPKGADEPSSETVPVESPDPGPVTSGAAAPVAIPVGSANADTATSLSGSTGRSSTVEAGVSADVHQSVGAGVSSASLAESATRAAAIGEVGGAEIVPGVTLAPATAAAASPAVTPTGVSQSSPVASAAKATVKAARPAIQFAAGHVPLAAAVLAAVALGATGLITRRALTRNFAGEGRVSDRFGIVLQHLKTGDTLCRLTSCPGPLPSQSRGH